MTLNLYFMKIVLVGYMGAGKTAIGKILAEKMNLSFFDLDQLIENEENNTVATIFDKKGELYFRKLERKCLENFLQVQQNYILALGGGTPCYFDNFKLYQADDITSIYLKANTITLVTRLVSNLQNRPLLQNLDKEALTEFVAKHLFERNSYYNQVTLIQPTDENSIQEISETLFNQLT